MCDGRFRVRDGSERYVRYVSCQGLEGVHPRPAAANEVHSCEVSEINGLLSTLSELIAWPKRENRSGKLIHSLCKQLISATRSIGQVSPSPRPTKIQVREFRYLKKNIALYTHVAGCDVDVVAELEVIKMVLIFMFSDTSAE